MLDFQEELVIFQTVRKAADGGILEARRTGTKVVNNTTIHPPTKSMSVPPHGNENAAPSLSQMAL